jgi:DNA mismatch endonuclease (patch repair protein)
LGQRNAASVKTDIFPAAKRSQIMQAVRTKGTQPEIVVQSLLRGLGHHYRRNVSALPGKPDFIVLQKAKAIFVHGCFWHGHQQCKKGQTLPQANRSFWDSKIRMNIRRDRRAVAQLRKDGWSVLTIWECRLKDRERASALLSRFMQRTRVSKLGARYD